MFTINFLGLKDNVQCLEKCKKGSELKIYTQVTLHIIPFSEQFALFLYKKIADANLIYLIKVGSLF